MAEVDAPPSPPLAPAQPALPTASLEEREREVLAELAREVDAWVTFTGLRRQLGVHQQALARTLRRLAFSGLIAHHGKGYQLTEAGFASLRGERAARSQTPAVIPVVQAILPPHVSAGDVAAQLSRRWFGGLRWYGQSEGPGETSLHWTASVEPPAGAPVSALASFAPRTARVTVRVSAGSVTLEVEDIPGTQARTFAAARPVLAALAELYGTDPGLVESSRRSAA